MFAQNDSGNISFGVDNGQESWFVKVAGLETLESSVTTRESVEALYPFITGIKADYLVSSHFEISSFVFIIQANPQEEAKCDFLCCSIFAKGNRNYETNQRSHTLLKKERIHISSNTLTVLWDKLAPKEKNP